MSEPGTSPVGPRPTLIDPYDVPKPDLVASSAQILRFTRIEITFHNRTNSPPQPYTSAVDLVPMVFSTGWASGVNAYLVVLVLGLADRFGHFSQIPDQLGRTDVLIGAAVLYALEFVADKVPYLDSTWDAISTVIRPTVGAAIGAVFAHHAGADPTSYATLGGLTALVSHLVKAGNRLAINTSPEPVTNIGASVGEDVAVGGVVGLAIAHPWAALTVSAVFLIFGIAILFVALRYVRRGWRRWKGRPLPSR